MSGHLLWSSLVAPLPPPPAKPAKKPKEERIAELKAKRRAEEAVKGEAPPAPEEEELSPEQQQQCQLEEKLRLLKVQQDSDLAIAMETFGGETTPRPLCHAPTPQPLCHAPPPSRKGRGSWRRTGHYAAKFSRGVWSL